MNMEHDVVHVTYSVKYLVCQSRNPAKQVIKCFGNVAT